MLSNGAVAHQKDSFDQFFFETLPHIVQENSDITIDYAEKDTLSVFSFHNVRTLCPSVTESNGFIREITPMEARLRHITYASSVFIDLKQTIYKRSTREIVETKIFTEILLARLPVMVGSRLCALNAIDAVSEGKECWFDTGGYFIINGIEKGFVSQEKLRINFPFVFEVKAKKKTVQCEVRSCHESKLRSTSTLYITSTRTGNEQDIVSVTVPFLTQQLSLPKIFVLFGVSYEQVKAMFHHEDDTVELKAVIEGCIQTDSEEWRMSREQVLKSLVAKRREKASETEAISHVTHILTNEVLPHIGLSDTTEVIHGKAWFICYSIRRMFKAMLGEIAFDDRDHYANKRIDTAGGLMSLLFRQLFRAFLKHTTVQLGKYVQTERSQKVNTFISHKKISNGFRYALATGNWGIQKSSATQMGTVQVLSRMTTVAPLSSLQRTNTPLCREGKAPEPRQLHKSSWGIVCASETPEGASCGLMKNLCSLTHIRLGIDTCYIWEVIEWVLQDFLQPPQRMESGDIPFFVNGVCKATIHRNSIGEVLATLRKLRRSLTLPPDISISFDRFTPSVIVTSDRGALCRPLFVVENMRKIQEITTKFKGALLPNLWKELIAHGCIEFVDKEEEREMSVAVSWQQLGNTSQCGDTPSWSHCEIHPTAINGLCAGQIPFSDHNQAPRNCYQSAMGKQAIGVYASNFLQRMDNLAHVLVQPQRPLVTTWTDEMLQTPQIPAGANAIVAIMCWGGHNQDDSVIFNRTSLENGMFSSMVYRTYKDEAKSNRGDVEQFELPKEDCAHIKTNNYKTLNGDSTAPVGTALQEGDIIIGKTVASKNKKRDSSMAVKSNEGGMVDLRMIADNGSHKVVKVRTCQLRQPITGDKFASRHGQKGVIGMIHDQKDMPFTADGLCPDIIVNPHAIPSRMTIGMLVEMLLSKECLLSGKFGDGTPFRGTSVEGIGDALEEMGFERNGREIMYNAMNGKKMEAHIFIAPAYYQRLKHMVNDKIHARSRGPVQLLTRQPNEGRSREGGLRFGEMERDCILAHGCAASLKEFLCDKSDPYVTGACKKCGLLCEPFHNQDSHKDKVGYCRGCQTSEHTLRVRIPYAMKLLLQELQALHVLVRFRFVTDSSMSDKSDKIFDYVDCEVYGNTVHPVFEFV